MPRAEGIIHCLSLPGARVALLRGGAQRDDSMPASFEGRVSVNSWGGAATRMSCGRCAPWDLSSCFFRDFSASFFRSYIIVPGW